MAKTVTMLYPTLTVPFSDIVEVSNLFCTKLSLLLSLVCGLFLERHTDPIVSAPLLFSFQQYVTALEASATHFVPDGAALAFGIPSGLGSIALVAVAAVAGGAFVL
jgi:hypothetical protein